MNLTVSSSPHIRGSFRSSRLMLDVVAALLPALAVGARVLGARALLVAGVCTASAVLTEALWSVLTRSRNTLADGSAPVTGLLLAMTLPVSIPLWQGALGSVFAVAAVKLMCGGLGQNVFNPALTARALMMLLWPLSMTRYPGLDGVTAATPLHHMVKPDLPQSSLTDMFLGRIPGSIGEISSLALLAGGVYLIARKVISPRIPAAYLGTVAILTLIFYKTDDPVAWMLYSVLGGSVMLAAFFMATDYSSSPVTPMGQLLYGTGCGALTVFLRYHSLYPEGVTYAILLMNACVWIIDRHTAPRRFGTGKGALL